MGTRAAVAESEPAASETAFFEQQIRPVLIEHCYQCHSSDAETIQGGLRVDTRDHLRKGGDSGPAVVPGNVEESLLVSALRYESFEMPPDGRLPETVIADFVKWIEMGAPDPRADEAESAASPDSGSAVERELWVFQPLERPPLPQTAGMAWCRSPIDRFILSRLEAAGLAPASDADKRTLQRRVYFDLIGLPPTPEEIAEFLSDDEPDAYPRMVERLLSSPSFGERWGRHWLDVARYADSTGGGRSMLYGDSWRYRDYVIRAFNSDKPFDRFIVEQIAGDLLPYEDFRIGQEQLTATGFLVLGAINYEEQDKEQLRMDVVDEQLDVIGRAFLGMTLGCARCHDHKFDPIPMTDYYAMAGILRSTQSLIDDNVSTWVKRPLPVDPETEERLRAHESQVVRLKTETEQRRAELQALRRRLPIVTLDDSEAVLAGSWAVSSSCREFVGEGYRYASGAGASATYRTSLPTPGMYEVRVSYSAHANRSTNALIGIEHGGARGEQRINQRQVPPLEGLYVSVGRYEFDGEAVVTISTDGADGVVIADSVQFVPLMTGQAGGQRVVSDASTLPGIVLDSPQAELAGEWMNSSQVPSYVGSGYIHDGRSGQPKQAVFRADLPESGEYEVRVSYNAAPSRSARVPVTVAYPGGETTVHINQQRTPDVDGLFATVGRFRFSNDQTALVTITNAGTTDGYVIVDAVQFVPVSELESLPAPESGESRALEGEALLETISAAERDISEMESRLKQLLEAAPPKPPTVPSVQEAADAGDCRICIRGNARNVGDVVPRGFLSAVTAEAPVFESASGRLELAEWIAADENPMTARVTANRIWQRLFGEGIVRSTDNFGATGERPSHPELLDYLAVQLQEQQWSIKSLVREIVLSRTYQLSSEPGDESLERDPENRLLSHQNRRRLDAEAIYDSLMSISGRLDRAIGGNTVREGTKTETDYEFENRRRAVYLPVWRNQLHDLMAAFDFPDPNLLTGRRETSTLATQALFMMNSPFVLEQSRFAAERLLRDAGSDSERIELLFVRAVGRPPTEVERQLAVEFLAGTEDSEAADRLDRWRELTQAVVGTAAFRFID